MQDEVSTGGLKGYYMRNQAVVIALGVVTLAILGCCCFFTLALMADSGSDSNNNQADKQKEEDKQPESEQPPAQPTPKEEPAPVPVESETDKLNKVMKDTIGTSHKKLEFNESTGLVTITEEGATYWDDTNTVQKAYRQLIDFGIKGFDNPNVKEIKFVIRTTFTDQYGKESINTAVRIAFKRDEFEKFNWDNLYGQNIYNQLLTSTSEFYIHPSVEEELKYDKLTYL